MRKAECGILYSTFSATHPKSEIPNRLVSSVRQHLLDSLLIAFAHECVYVEVPFPLLRLFGQNMTRVRMTAFEFAARRRAKTLCCAFVCF